MHVQIHECMTFLGRPNCDFSPFWSGSFLTRVAMDLLSFLFLTQVTKRNLFADLLQLGNSVDRDAHSSSAFCVGFLARSFVGRLPVHILASNSLPEAGNRSKTPPRTPRRYKHSAGAQLRCPGLEIRAKTGSEMPMCQRASGGKLSRNRRSCHRRRQRRHQLWESKFLWIKFLFNSLKNAHFTKNDIKLKVPAICLTTSTRALSHD